MKILELFDQTQNEIKEKESQLFAQELKLEQQKLMLTLETNISNANATVSKLTTNIKDFKANDWIQNYQQANLNLLRCEKELELARNTFDELFTENVENEKG